MFNNNASKARKIEYHTVGGDSTNFYNGKHEMVTMYIANSEQMFNVAKYFFEMGVNCTKYRHKEYRISYEQIYFKYNNMCFDDNEINPISEPEVIILDSDTDDELESINREIDSIMDNFA